MNKVSKQKEEYKKSQRFQKRDISYIGGKHFTGNNEDICSSPPLLEKIYNIRDSDDVLSILNTEYKQKEEYKQSQCFQKCNILCVGEKYKIKIANAIGYKDDIKDDIKIRNEAYRILKVNNLNDMVDKLGSVYNNQFSSNDIIIMKSNLKVKGPTDNAWLDNYNIDELLKRMSTKLMLYNRRKHYHSRFGMNGIYGSVNPKTGKTYPPQKHLSDIDMYGLYKKGYTSFSVVMNTDFQWGSGIHWYAMYVDMTGNVLSTDIPVFTVEYFNSAGNANLSADTNRWLENTVGNLKNGLKNTNYRVEKIINTTFHQTSTNTECGVYSIVYILSRMFGVSYSKINSKPLQDIIMEKWIRLLLFIDKN